jgi:hypothetical protein
MKMADIPHHKVLCSNLRHRTILDEKKANIFLRQIQSSGNFQALNMHRLIALHSIKSRKHVAIIRPQDADPDCENKQQVHLRDRDQFRIHFLTTGPYPYALTRFLFSFM